MSKMFDPTKPVQTRDGRKARILTDNLKGRDLMVAAVLQPNGEEGVYHYQLDGRYTSYTTSNSDLVNVPERQTLYLNVYLGAWRQVGSAYRSREEADRCAEHDSRTACIRLEVEEGRFDE